MLGLGSGAHLLWPARAGPHHRAHIHGMSLRVSAVATHWMTLRGVNVRREEGRVSMYADDEGKERLSST